MSNAELLGIGGWIVAAIACYAFRGADQDAVAAEAREAVLAAKVSEYEQQAANDDKAARLSVIMERATDIDAAREKAGPDFPADVPVGTKRDPIYLTRPSIALDDMAWVSTVDELMPVVSGSGE